MAHVQKRGSQWQARYRAPDGRERTQRFARKVDAQKWLDTNRADVARGRWIDPAAGLVTFADYSKLWLATKVDVSARTLINLEGRLANHATPAFGRVSLVDVKPSSVRAWVAKMTGAGMAPSTVKGVFLTVSQVFGQAVVDGLIAQNPCTGVRLPPERAHAEQAFLSAPQVVILADAIDDRYRALIYTAAYAGLRAGELAALRVNQVDVLGGTLSVTGAASEVRGELVFGRTKTGKSRVVGIPRSLAQMLGEHVGRYPSADGFVFTAREGGPIRHRNLYRRHFRPAVEVARDVDPMIPEGLRFHDLRHTCAALLIADGRHLEQVKAHLGHGSIRTTSDRYGHLFPSARQELADGLDAVFVRAAAQPAADKRRTSGDIRPLRDASQGA